MRITHFVTHSTQSVTDTFRFALLVSQNIIYMLTCCQFVLGTDCHLGDDEKSWIVSHLGFLAQAAARDAFLSCCLCIQWRRPPSSSSSSSLTITSSSCVFLSPWPTEFWLFSIFSTKILSSLFWWSSFVCRSGVNNRGETVRNCSSLNQLNIVTEKMSDMISTRNFALIIFRAGSFVALTLVTLVKHFCQLFQFL